MFDFATASYTTVVVTVAFSVFFTRLVAAESERVGHLSARLGTLGPAATLARGYAVVQAGSHVLRSVADAPAGTELRIRVSDGAVRATSEGASDV